MRLKVGCVLAGQMEAGVELAIVFKEQARGFVGLHFQRTVIGFKQVGPVLHALVYKEVIEVQPGGTFVGMRHVGRNQIHVAASGLYVFPGQMEQRLSVVYVVDAHEGR